MVWFYSTGSGPAAVEALLTSSSGIQNSRLGRAVKDTYSAELQREFSLGRIYLSPSAFDWDTNVNILLRQ